MNFAQLPATTQIGLILTSTGDGQGGCIWSQFLSTLPYTYSVSGTLVVPSGATGFLPPFFWPVPSGQTVTLISMQIMVRSGSLTANIQQNGLTIGGLSALAVTTTSTTFTPTNPVNVANLDYFAPVITAVTAADGLSCTFVYTVNA